MKTYVIVHGSIRTAEGFVGTGKSIELEESEAKKLDSQLGKPGASLVLKATLDAEKAAAAAAEKAKAESLAKTEADEKAKIEAEKAAAAAAKAQKGGK